MSLISRLLLGLTSIWAMPAQAQEVTATDYQTYTYFDSSRLKLELDLFLPETAATDTTPLVIFVHGGGFAGGERADGHDLARYLRDRNIACASISYTLYMRGKNFSCDGVLSEKVKAIQLAASELWQATHFLLERAEEFAIDSSKIFIAGSSAGAETVLHAAYWDRTVMQYYHTVLPADFKYAAVISGAGAIMDLNLITADNQLPTFLFHGDLDQLVPYATAAHHYCQPNAPGWLMLFGSHSIAEHHQRLNGTARLISFKSGGHEFSGYYFYKEIEQIHEFIQAVLEGDQFVDFRVEHP